MCEFVPRGLVAKVTQRQQSEEALRPMAFLQQDAGSFVAMELTCQCVQPVAGWTF